MSDVISAIIGCFPLVLVTVLLVYGLSWLSGKILPKNPLRRRTVRTGARLVLLEPIRKSYQAIRWVCVTAYNANPHYRTHQLYMEDYPVTPLELYAVIEAAINRRNIIGVEASRVSRLEWHLLSLRRVYLLVRLRDAICFIGAARMGNGLLISWRYSIWPGRIRMVIFELPFFGVLAKKIFLQPTFHRTDLYFAFEQTIRMCVAEATDTLAGRGLRPLAENEQQPLLREFYG